MTTPHACSVRGTPFTGSSVADLLRFRAEAQPDAVAYTFLEDGEVEAASWTWRELDRRARVIGARLQASAAPGDRALLMYPAGLEFIAAFFACLYTGVTAVPVQPPQRSRSQRGVDRVHAIIGSAAPAVALTSSGTRDASDGPMPWLQTDTFDDDVAERSPSAAVTSDTLAFLQFTSGSTASPKGVMITHANLLHNLAYGFHAGDTDHTTVSVSWLPVTHDMGLIEGVLQPAFSGSPAYLMSPGSFLQRPARWLKALSRYRGTRSGGPNFAYDLAVSRVSVADRAGLDLSCWKAAYNGAEPVRADTMAAFAAAYEGAGFRASAFRPCYGLAESTLLVASCRWNEARAGESDVSCGTPACGTTVVIADPVSGRPCRDGELGEIRVAGPGVARGYWNDPEETARVFVAMPGSDTRWLRTGDLGVRAHDGLHVTGRLKDLLIVRGAKHFPQDVERTAEALHPAIRRGAVTAVAVANGVRGDQVAVIAETDPRRFADHDDMAELMATIRYAVAEAHGIQLHAVSLVPPGGVPKTSSGKPRRYLCREAWVQGTLQPLAAWLDSGRAVVPGER